MRTQASLRKLDAEIGRAVVPMRAPGRRTLTPIARPKLRVASLPSGMLELRWARTGS